MQPQFLSLEPLMLGSFALLLICVLPVLLLSTLKLRPTWRAATTVLSVVGLSVYFFWLGEAVGRSKAWYHWRSQYQGPLNLMQAHMKQLAEAQTEDALKEFCEKFAKENIQGYGREELFSKSPFNEFITTEAGKP
jgi:ABC-type antimicrobial peptide transport system permease subunit